MVAGIEDVAFACFAASLLAAVPTLTRDDTDEREAPLPVLVPVKREGYKFEAEYPVDSDDLMYPPLPGGRILFNG